MALLIGAVGVAFAAGGGWLLALGGSPYYAVAAVALLVTAWGLWAGRRWGPGLYGLFLGGTLLWALAEAGPNAWALAPRLLGPAVVGLPLLIPARAAAGRLCLAASLAITLAAFLGAAVLARPDTVAARAPLRPAGPAQAAAGWGHYGADAGGSRYAPLADITPANVGLLQRIWTYHVGLPSTPGMFSLEMTPLEAHGRLFGCTGYNDIFALDARTGRELWRYRPHVNPAGVLSLTCRGVARYEIAGAQGPCAERILAATVDARLIALDAATGQPCRGFGAGGGVDLTAGLGRVDKGYYYVTSAPAVVRGRVVLGGWVTDGQKLDEPSGVIRAFDAVTGQLAWAWDMGRPDRQGAPPPGEAYTRGTPNSWGPISADETLGLVYLPTGNATPDYFGAHRSAASERFSSSVVALDAQTGALRWSFQTAHHDIWDYDVGAQPTLTDVQVADHATPALLLPTKRGEIFLLDRRTGTPLAQVTEQPVATDAAPGERPSPTQPFSTGMPSFAGPRLTEARMWGLTPLDQLWCRLAFRRARYEGPMTPLGLTRTIVFPGYLGGIDWGGVSVDPGRRLMIVNSDQVGNYDRLMPRTEADRLGLRADKAGEAIYRNGDLPQMGTPYAVDVKPFLSPLGAPCQQPPYGVIAAVDLDTHKLVWSHPFGTAAGAGPLGLRSHLPIRMGVPNIGGSTVTAGGVVFIGASQDGMLRAYDEATGRPLWETRLPAGGQATPTVFKEPGGRETLVIAAGGNLALHTLMGDELVAYALPAAGR